MRAARQAQRAAADDEVVVGRRDVNPAGSDRLTVGRVGRLQGAGPVEGLGQERGGVRRHVLHDENRGLEPGGQPGDDAAQRLEPARRRPYRYDVVSRHALAWTQTRTGNSPMEHADQTAKRLHDLAQDLQVLAMAIAAIERRDGARHAKVLEPARRALERLDRGLEELLELARRGRDL